MKQEAIGGEKRLLSMAEFCDRYGISKSHAFKLASDNSLPTVRVGRRRLVSVDAAEAWMAGLIAEQVSA